MAEAGAGAAAAGEVWGPQGQLCQWGVALVPSSVCLLEIKYIYRYPLLGASTAITLGLS